MSEENFRISSVVLASPNAVYSAWLDERKHSAFTGGRATVEPWVGGRHTAWDGYIEGMLTGLDTGRRISMTWRTTDFPADALMSRVEVDLEPVPGGTKITIAHFDIPEGQEEQYKKGWRSNYLDPMKKFFSKPGAMKAAVRAASKARRLPIPGVTSARPGSVRPPTSPRPANQKKTAKTATKKAAAKRAGEKPVAKKAAKKATKKKAAPKRKAPAKKVTKKTTKKAAKKKAAKKVTKKTTKKAAKKKAAPKRKAPAKKVTKKTTKKAAKKKAAPKRKAPAKKKR